MHRLRQLSAVRISTHGDSRLCLSHSVASPSSGERDPRLGFVRNELEGLRSRGPEQAREPARDEVGRGVDGGGREVEISHPWPEWVELMECLLKKGYLDRSALGRDSASSSSLTGSKDSNQIRTACLNFARDRFDLIRYLSRRDIQILVGSGCPSLDRKVVNSGKRMRAHVGIEEGDVCSSCILRGNCGRAYVNAREDEGGRTIDVMRILLTHGLDIITGSVENPASLTKTIKESVRKLLNEIVEFSDKELDSSTQTMSSGRPLQSGRHQMLKGQIAIPMKQGDWICPKCNFLNFAKNIKCLRCNGEFQERFMKLREDQEHLPLKKGDWICEKCNFLNFAKNTKCLQCHEKPPKRQLNPGEWECESCNYINFRRNGVCLKCDWKRPKALSSGGRVAESHSDNQGQHKNSSISFVRDDRGRNGQQVGLFPTEHEDSEFWSSRENRGDDGDDSDNLNVWNNHASFDNFPILGGRSSVSQDPLVRERWKEEMFQRSKGLPVERTEERYGGLGSLRSTIEMDESSGEEEIAEWFRSGTNDNKLEKYY